MPVGRMSNGDGFRMCRTQDEKYSKPGGFEYNTRCRDVAQLGSALPWGGRGHGFESRRSDQIDR